MVPMLVGMTERGPDSAGMAVFAEPCEDKRKLSLYCDRAGFDWRALESAWIAAHRRRAFERKANHCIVTTRRRPRCRAGAGCARTIRSVHVLSAGRSIDLYKDIGAPAEVAERYGFSNFSGTHLVGHTRMATESAVTPEHAHPFTAGEDFCLVHNGSLSNPVQPAPQAGAARRAASRRDNDTEAACRFLEWRLREARRLEAGAASRPSASFDGFYTFLMGTRDKLALVRDPFACKPAVVAETDDYVAIASEFRSLAHLPGIKHAKCSNPSRPRSIHGKCDDAGLAACRIRSGATERARAQPVSARRPVAACSEVLVKNPDGAHNLAVGLDARCGSTSTATPATTRPA